YANQLTIVFWMFLVVLYGVVVGINPILRASELIFPFTLLVFLFILGFAIQDFNPIFLKPILNNPVQDIFKNSILISLRNFELIPLVYLIDRVGDSKKRTIFGYIIFFSLIHELRTMTLLLTLGEYGNIQLYPAYALAALVEASIFQRLDSIYTIVWVLMAFIKLALFLWLSLDVLKQSLATKYHSYLLPVLSTILVGTTVWKNSFYTTQALKIIYLISTGLFIIILIGIPILLLALKILPNRRVKE
ncbi:MAG TPA: hypothetical protein DCY20_08660, partial [Firmicutes bacterium]|nr:hypothetical protein [Bacillota bacterium]